MEHILKAVENRIILFDGGIGTMLQQRGLPVGEPPERWNLDNPQAVTQVHRQYVDAGAEVVTTNSFGGHPHKLAPTGLRDHAYHINKTSAELARQAVATNGYVAGSIGPTGAILMLEEVPQEEVRTGFELQARGLVAGGIDLFIIETMTDLAEVRLAFQAIKAVSDLPIIISMTFEPGHQGYRTIMGVDIATALAAMHDLGADIAATNCGAGIDQAIEIVAEMRQRTKLPILAEPNAGLPQLINGQTVYLESPEKMAGKLHGLIKAGANLVGGCCGTTPEHIRFFRKMIRDWDKTA